MPQIDDKHVLIKGCFVVWNGVTSPEQGENGPKYSLKVVADPNNPDVALFDQLGQATLQQSEFKGVLPAGGRMNIGTASSNEFNGMYTGWAVINGNTKRVPDVYDENGNLLEPMQYGQLLYGGQKVDILVHCYAYNAKGNKGVAAGLDGFAIIASANAPRQNFGGAGIDTSSVFGGGGGQQQGGFGQNGQNNQQQQGGGFNQNNQQQQGGGFNQNNQQQGGFGQNGQNNQQQQGGGFNQNNQQQGGFGQNGQNNQQQQGGGFGQQQQDFMPQ